MGQITKLVVLVFLVACSGNASASFMHNSDATDDDSRAEKSHQRVTDRSSFDVDDFFSEIEVAPGEHSDVARKRRDITRKYSGVIRKKEKDHSWSSKWIDDDDFFTDKHPRRDNRHFEPKWPGYEGHHPKIDYRHHRDHVPVVPLPAAVWLFGSGLIGLIAFARKKA